MLYVIVTGGVISGLGKGITASSIGLILKAYGFRVTAIKVDPYLNVDSGTMSPFEHGECYVLDDGGETDLDLGNYERFLDINLTKAHSLTTGKLYRNIIEKERRGDYLGQTVQIMPHVTDYIQTYISDTAKIPVDSTNAEPEVCIVEIGGTVGDHESGVYFEALSEFSKTHKCLFVHVSLLINTGEDVKTKPTQHSIRHIRSMGIEPGLLILRTTKSLSESEATLEKISKMCKMNKKNIIVNSNVKSIYEVPKLFMDQNIIEVIGRNFSSDIDPCHTPELTG
jgi:CTP synthase